MTSKPHNVLTCRVLVSVILILAVVGTTPFAAQQCAKVPSRTAVAYYDWTLSCIDAIGRDMPDITKSATAAAKRYVEEDNAICAMGDEGFTGEVVGRSGGIMWMRHINSRNGKSVVMYAIREDRFDDAVKQLNELHDRGCMVIVFARKSILALAKKAGAKWDAAVDNHAAPNGGLFKTSDGKWIVPTDTTANAIASWTWIGEFVAACTRLGKLPTMFQGFAVPGGKDRAKRIGHLKFHEETPYPAEPGRYGHEFLWELKRDLLMVHNFELGDIHRVAMRAVENLNAGKGVYTFIHGHCAMHHVGYPGDPGYFTQLNDGWFDQRKDIALKPGDFVYCVGFNQLFEGWEFGTWTSDTRKAGVELAWSIAGYRRANKFDGAGAILPSEIFVNQHWRFGDAVVKVPQYDINILPTSGVLAEVTFWMANADIYGILTQKGCK